MTCMSKPTEPTLVLASTCRDERWRVPREALHRGWLAGWLAGHPLQEDRVSSDTMGAQRPLFLEPQVPDHRVDFPDRLKWMWTTTLMTCDLSGRHPEEPGQDRHVESATLQRASALHEPRLSSVRACLDRAFFLPLSPLPFFSLIVRSLLTRS